MADTVRARLNWMVKPVRYNFFTKRDRRKSAGHVNDCSVDRHVMYWHLIHRRSVHRHIVHVHTVHRHALHVHPVHGHAIHVHVMSCHVFMVGECVLVVPCKTTLSSETAPTEGRNAEVNAAAYYEQ